MIFFFHSLGNDLEHRAIGIILSGTGTDGSRGIATIKESGGTIIVQEPSSAQFDGMPLTAINSNLADYILTPAKIGEELGRIADRPKFILLKEDETEESKEEGYYNQILEIIYKNSGIDFKQYKPATLIRRIEKRISICQLGSLKDYAVFLKKSSEEQELLYNDFLIGVTAFFRDPAAYMELKEKVFPEIFISEKQNEIIRFWSVGCSTGEEAYSLAILIDEYIKENNLTFDYKIFATDADAKSIQIAGLGRYPVNLVSDISKERHRKIFYQNRHTT
ncbi:MAG: hypothetical protein HC906_01035 [Bacteroidales bacterium]|nr:hypothetical protein [Bacteroidales bacterium]